LTRNIADLQKQSYLILNAVIAKDFLSDEAYLSLKIGII